MSYKGYCDSRRLFRAEGKEGSATVRCPFCGVTDSRVIDSRPTDEGATIRRRRECASCQKRFTTYEIVEQVPLVVIKKDGSRQTFDRMKLLGSMLRACEKRTVSLGELESASVEIEQELQNSLEREIPTSRVGELVMTRLKSLDEVAYVRFASVYRQFKDINTFMEELHKLVNT
jgi:transcriptional repressor NrdR